MTWFNEYFPKPAHAMSADELRKAIQFLREMYPAQSWSNCASCGDPIVIDPDDTIMEIESGFCGACRFIDSLSYAQQDHYLAGLMTRTWESK